MVFYQEFLQINFERFSIDNTGFKQLRLYIYWENNDRYNTILDKLYQIHTQRTIDFCF